MHAVIIALLCNQKQFHTLLPDFIAHFFLSGTETLFWTENACCALFIYKEHRSSFNFVVNICSAAVLDHVLNRLRQRHQYHIQMTDMCRQHWTCSVHSRRKHHPRPLNWHQMQIETTDIKIYTADHMNYFIFISPLKNPFMSVWNLAFLRFEMLFGSSQTKCSIFCFKTLKQKIHK